MNEVSEPKVILSLMFFTMSFAFFFMSAVSYTGYWISRKVWVGQTATALTCVASFSIFMVLVFRTIESGHAPFSNLFESMVLFIWALSVGYLMMEYRYKMKIMGAFVMTIATLSMLSAWLLPFRFKSIEPLNPALQSKWHWLVDFLGGINPKLEKFAIGWLDFHVFTTFISYAAFAIAFGLSIMYLTKSGSKMTGHFTNSGNSKIVNSFSGFSWPALFFSWVWSLGKGMRKLALIAAGATVVAYTITYFLLGAFPASDYPIDTLGERLYRYLIVFILFVPAIAPHVTIGFYANKLHVDFIKKAGFKPSNEKTLDVSKAGNLADKLVLSMPEANILDEISYRMIAWGFPFLLIGIVSGAMWANYAWGTYWSWDPKETWSLITWFIYAAYLHARVTRGWRGTRAAYLSIIGFIAVIFLYWGVSFILPGLHAYA